jgi:two-component system alkaline phosphatase synthesis response regulator PhoP
MKVLIVDNDEKTLEFLGDILSKEGFDVTKATGGREALEKYSEAKPDFICLDIMMPDMNGYDVCRKIRQENQNIPLIFISAKDDPAHKIAGLELGADDYITKPFDIGEISARIRAVARRCFSQNKKEAVNDFFDMADLKIFPQQLKARRGEKIIDLSLRDIKILKILHDHKNQVVDRNVMLDHCWGAHIMPESRTVDWHISQLRKRVEKDPKSCEIIKTVHGVGYIYEAKNSQ